MKETVQTDAGPGNGSGLTPARLAEWSGGRWTPGPPDRIRGVCHDTRGIGEGDLYVALPGTRYDGHEFVADAFARGAAGALVSSWTAIGSRVDGPLLLVADTAAAFRALAAGYRDLVDPFLIGVTGSVGKTTVKDMLAGIFLREMPTARTRGNWNNAVGLPASLLKMMPGDRAGVFELGTSHPGEMAALAALLKPDWGVVTAVGVAHTEFFPSLEAVAAEKAELLRALPSAGVAVLFRDTECFEALRAAAPGRVITVSLAGDADYVCRAAAGDGFELLETATGETVPIALRMPGTHFAVDAALAAAVARTYGLGWETVTAALADFRPAAMRWQLETVAGVTVINDAYNANPMSMMAAVEAFRCLRVDGGKWLVLGDMLELGRRSREEHEALGRFLAERTWAGIVTVGLLGRSIAAAAADAGFPPERIVPCTNVREAARVLRNRLRPGDAVLLKASRAIRLEDVVLAWKQPANGANHGESANRVGNGVACCTTCLNLNPSGRRFAYSGISPFAPSAERGRLFC